MNQYPTAAQPLAAAGDVVARVRVKEMKCLVLMKEIRDGGLGGDE